MSDDLRFPVRAWTDEDRQREQYFARCLFKAATIAKSEHHYGMMQMQCARAAAKWKPTKRAATEAAA